MLKNINFFWGRFHMKPGIGKQYLVFGAGLFFTAAGISLITKAGLGTSPVTSPAYVLSMLCPLTLGMATFLNNLVMFFGQVVLLKGRMPLSQLLQIPATFVFSLFIDLVTQGLSLFHPASYGSRLGLLLMGCVVMGFGIALEVLADVLILPGEGIVKTISQVFRWKFSKVKTTFDLSLVALAVLLSFVGLGHIAGVREGTVIAAAIVGSIAGFFKKRLAFISV